MSKKVKIIIGEQYLFDVMGKTNIAPQISTVTVLKKVFGTRNRYYVRGDENGFIFKIHRKYLTPIHELQSDNILIRNPYGVTDFDDCDVRYFDIVLGVIEDAKKTSNYTIPDQQEDSFIRLTNILKNKVKKYADISNYLENVALINGLSKLNKIFDNSRVTIDRDDTKSLNDFGVKMSKFMEDYMIDPNIDMDHVDHDDFLDSFTDFLRDEFPSDVLKHEVIVTDDDIKSLTKDIKKSVEKDIENIIAILIFINEDEELDTYGIDSTNIDKVEDILGSMFKKHKSDNRKDEYYTNSRITFIAVDLSLEDDD